MIQAAAPLSSDAFIRAQAGSDYFATEVHHQYLARRIVAALRGDSRFVLVTGDPPANLQILTRALSIVAAPRHTAIGIPCGPDLTCDELEHATLMSARPPWSGGMAGELEGSAPASPLFVFDDLDRFSDGQIEDIHKTILRGDQTSAAGVLLAHPDFLARLERPALHFLKEDLAAHFRVQEIGEDEGIAFLHNQLLAQRYRRIEARGFRRGILIGVAACGVLVTASIGAFLHLQPTAKPVFEASANTADSSSSSEGASVLQAAVREATSAVPAQPAPATELSGTLTTPPLPLVTPGLPATTLENPQPVAPPALAPPPAGPRLSAAELATLLGRGNMFLSAGDIASARLFYERAADAGNGVAALQLGATFDPLFLGRGRVRGVAVDPGQALSWYRRAHDLGVAEADQRIKSLDTRPLGEPNTRPH